MSDPQIPILPPKPEPAFNAPWQTVALLAAMAVAFAAQTLTPEPEVMARFAFSPRALTQGRFETLVTALFVHAGWLHLGMNALGALAFGAPIARYVGQGARAGLAFFAFYLVCGVFANLAYAVVHPFDPGLLVGASGGVSGLMGAASRLLDRRGQLGPFMSRSVIGMGAAWVVINLVFAVMGTAPGAGGAPIAWEAHLAGYAAGLLLIGPFGWLAGAEDRGER